MLRAMAAMPTVDDLTEEFTDKLTTLEKTLAIAAEGPHGWKFVRANLKRVIEYGRAEGILPPAGEEDVAFGDSLGRIGAVLELNTGEDVAKGKETVHTLNLPEPHADDSFIQDAIPYLPLSLALFCFAANICAPGTGTALSGVLCLCFGLPRIRIREGKRIITLLVNFGVAVAQIMTLSFFLVGWFWAIAWGGLIVTHALQYRQALIEKRQELAATAALEVFTKNNILHRSNLKSVMKAHRKDKSDSGKPKTIKKPK